MFSLVLSFVAKNLLTDLARFVNHILAGKNPASLGPLFLGVSPWPTRRKEDAAALANILRRLVAKPHLEKVSREVTSLVWPNWLALGILSCCPAITHLSHVCTSSHASVKAQVKLDL